MASVSLKAGTFYGNANALAAAAGTGLVKSCAWDDFAEFIDACRVPALVFVGDSDYDGYDRPLDIIRHWQKRSYDFYDKVLTSEKFLIDYVCNGPGANFAYYIAKDYRGDAIDASRFIGIVAGDDYPRLCLYWKKQNGAVIKKVLSYGVAYPSGDSEMISEMNRAFTGYQPLPWYTITYDANGAQQSDPDGTTAASGEKVRLSDAKMTMLKFEFAGWEIDGTVYEAGSEYTLVKSVVAKATWRRKSGGQSQYAEGASPSVGEWTSAFTAAKEIADNQGVPLVLIATSTGCTWCNTFDADVLAKRDFQDWCASKPYLFCKVKANLGNWTSGEQKAILDFVGSGGLPRFSVYWNRTNYDGGRTVGAKDLTFAARSHDVSYYEAFIEQHVGAYAEGVV